MNRNPKTAILHGTRVGRHTVSDEPRDTNGCDKRNTMPKGGYRFGKSDPALRPVVPEGE